ncbi:MAG: hypothetical protein ACPHID_04895, partial [Thermoplasmatota archaeon]
MRAWWALLLLVPMAAGQGHEHGAGSGYVIASDLGPDGFAYVGSPAHFELIALGDDHIPDFHVDLPVRVTLDGQLLYETTPTSGHDYDGVHGFDVVFPRPGTWKVSILSDGEPVASRTGQAVAVTPDGSAGSTTVRGPVIGVDGFEFEIDTDTGPGRANHTDLLLEVFQDNRAVFRTHLHIHDEPATFTYRHDLGSPATAQVTRYTAFPQPGVAPLPVTSTALPIPTHLPLPLPAVPSPELPAAKNAVVTTSGTYDLVGTFDPYTQVGPDTLQHLNVLVLDPETGEPIQHVDFEAALTGPPGLIFQSSSLHEYDGIYTLETRQRVPGQYHLDVTAKRGDWSDDIRLTYYVLPPVMATLAGPQTVALSQDTFTTGQATPFSWNIADLAGRPFAHGELDLRIVKPGDPDRLISPQVYIRDKIHTHADGTFEITYAFPEPGSWPLLTDPFPLDPHPVGPFTYNTIQSAAGYVATVTGEAPTGTPIETNDPTTPGNDAPMPVALLLTGLAVAIRARQ